MIDILKFSLQYSIGRRNYVYAAYAHTGIVADACGSIKKLGIDSPFQIAVHYREENLQKQVDRIYQHSEQVQPCFAGHLEYAPMLSPASLTQQTLCVLPAVLGIGRAVCVRGYASEVSAIWVVARGLWAS